MSGPTVRIRRRFIPPEQRLATFVASREAERREATFEADLHEALEVGRHAKVVHKLPAPARAAKPELEKLREQRLALWRRIKGRDVRVVETRYTEESVKPIVKHTMRRVCPEGADLKLLMTELHNVSVRIHVLEWKKDRPQPAA